MHPPYELSARVCCDESNCFHSSSSTAMRGSLRAEEAMEATGMLAQRFERSAAVERLKRLELLPPACCLVPDGYF
jgi:hypothetical protein